MRMGNGLTGIIDFNDNRGVSGSRAMIVTMYATKMKRTAVLLFALCAVSCGAPEQKLRIRVTDESGTPLKDVACMGGWWKDVFVHGVTDQDGIVELTGQTRRHETLAKATIEGYSGLMVPAPPAAWRNAWMNPV
jgi:hypothetical protein